MIELLAPAGNYESLRAAIAAGANAVYLSGTAFGARSFAGNFNNEELVEAVKYAHLRDVKVYVTVNTLVKNSELEMLFDYIEFLYNNDVDAVIIQDLGVLNIMNKHFPDFEKHASTQMAIYDEHGYSFLEKHGFKRGVIARESNIETIKVISDATDVEIEAFVHGALCYSYSGLCLMSSIIGGRSGNRGKCAQPCRKLYSTEDEDRGYLLSPKDLNTYEEVHEIIKAGANSLKIEGRMRSPEYVYTVVNAYRRMIDDFDNGGDASLEKAFNREFTKGYILNEKPDKLINPAYSSNHGVLIGEAKKSSKFKMQIQLIESLRVGDKLKLIGDNSEKGVEVFNIYIDGRKQNHADSGQFVEIDYKGDLDSNTVVRRTYDISLKDMMYKAVKADNIVPIKVEMKIKVGELPLLSIKAGEHMVEVHGESVVEKSINTSMNDEKLFKSIDKMGDSPYYILESSFDYDSDSYIPQKTINMLRREALDKLDSIRLNKNNRDFHCDDYYLKNIKHVTNENNGFKFYAMTLNQLKALEKNNISECYFSDIKRMSEAKEIFSGEIFPWYLPINSLIVDGDKACVSNPGDLRDSVKSIDTFLNVMNNETIEFLEKNYDPISINLSMELNRDEIRDINSKTSELGYVCYGYPIVMISKSCPKKTLGKNDCMNCDVNFLIDEKDEKFYYKCIDGVTYFFNGKPILIKPFMLERLSNIDNMNIYLTIEKETEADFVIDNILKNEGRDIEAITAGHFNRGVL